MSERAFCRGAPIARMTLRDEKTRQSKLDAAPELVAFFGSPVGHLFLSRLVLAAHFVMTMLGPCGVPLVVSFLIFAGLGPFVATSYGSQQKIHAWLEKKIVCFGREEQQRLTPSMPNKKIWLCEDETFFARMILVGVEALSDFILLEKYSEHRDAASWNQCVSEQLAGLPVEVAGVTADGATGISAHALQSFGVDVTPDCFHIIQYVSPFSSAPLARRVESLEQQVAQGTAKGQSHKALEPLQERLQEAREHHLRVKTALEGLSEAYRPYDDRTGEIFRGARVKDEMNQMLDEIEIVADEAALSAACQQGIDKARRTIDACADAVENYHRRLALNLRTMRLPPAIAEAMRTQVLPALYLQKVARQSQDAETAQRLERRAHELVAPLQDDNSPMMQLTQEAVAYLLSEGKSWVEMFERSSSRVEGRNGQLELHHHGLRGLSDAKLAALTVVRNYCVRRNDGTTAAEKFFEQSHRDLFEWLLDVMPDLPRPAQKRLRLPQSPLLN